VETVVIPTKSEEKKIKRKKILFCINFPAGSDVGAHSATGKPIRKAVWQCL
jgi:hypothetical protein